MIKAFAFSCVIAILAVGTYLKSRNDGNHVTAMVRQAEAQERIAKAVEEIRWGKNAKP